MEFVMEADLKNREVEGIISESLEGHIINNTGMTIEDALKVGIKGHKAGHFELAGKVYETIIKLQPDNADANYSMGLLKMELETAFQALPYFENAVLADTSIFVFWASYLTTLIQTDRVDEAQNILGLASKGLTIKEFRELDRVINILLPDDTSNNTEK